MKFRIEIPDRIDIYHHFPTGRVDQTELAEILTHVRALRKQGVSLMSKLDELKQELVEANTVTNEIASDVDGLVARLEGGLSPAEADEVKGQLVALKERLTGVAAKYTPDAAPAEPVE